MPRLPDGSPKIDMWAFRRQMAETFQADMSDVLVSIQVVVVARDFRSLAAVHAAANNLFNISITVCVSPTNSRNVIAAHSVCFFSLQMLPRFLAAGGFPLRKL